MKYLSFFLSKGSQGKIINLKKLYTLIKLIIIDEQIFRLESLSLGNLACVRDETLKVISHVCQQLTYLDVTRCTGITDSGIQ